MALPVVGIDIPAVDPCNGVHRQNGNPTLPKWRSPGKDTYVCPQCDGRHEHHWVKCTEEDIETVRCIMCGGHKCPVPVCGERAYHLGPHLFHGQAQ